MQNIISNILKEAKWITALKDESWRNQYVTHITPSGLPRRVMVKSLPPEEQEKYNPNRNKNKKPSAEDLIKHHKPPDLDSFFTEEEKNLPDVSTQPDVKNEKTQKQEKSTNNRQMLYDDNDYSNVSYKTLMSNLKNNLNREHVVNTKIQTKNIKEPELLTNENWESKHKVNIFNNAKLVLRKYSKSLPSDTHKMVTNHIHVMTDAVEQGIHDNSLKANASDVDALLQHSIKLLVHQEIETRQRGLGDHGIRHILSNAENTHSILNELNKGGIHTTGAEKLATSIAQINHDIGYTVGDVATNILVGKNHKTQSGQLFDKDERYKKIFGKDLTNKMSDWIKTHDDNNFDWKANPIGSSIRLSDSVSLFGKDKIQELFYRSGKATKVLAKMKIASNAGLSITPYKKELHRVLKTMNLHDNQKMELKKSIDEMSNQYGMDDVLSRYSGKLNGFNYNKDKNIVEVNMMQSPEHETIQSLFEVGQKQFKKLINNFTGVDKNAKPLGYQETVDNNPNKTLFLSRDKKPTFQLNILGRDTIPINATTNKELKDVMKNTIRADLNHIRNKLTAPPELTQDKIKNVLSIVNGLNMEQEEKDQLKTNIKNMVSYIKRKKIDTEKLSPNTVNRYQQLSKKISSFPLTKKEKQFLQQKVATVTHTIDMTKVHKAIQKAMSGLQRLGTKASVKYTQQTITHSHNLHYVNVAIINMVGDWIQHQNGRLIIGVIKDDLQYQDGTIFTIFESNREELGKAIWTGSRWIAIENHQSNYELVKTLNH